MISATSALVLSTATDASCQYNGGSAISGWLRGLPVDGVNLDVSLADDAFGFVP
jgi:hypothetical protein